MKTLEQIIKQYNLENNVNAKEITKKIMDYNKSPNSFKAWQLSQILGYEPDTDYISGTYLPRLSLDKMIENSKLPVSEFF